MLIIGEVYEEIILLVGTIASIRRRKNKEYFFSYSFVFFLTSFSFNFRVPYKINQTATKAERQHFVELRISCAIKCVIWS